MSKTKATKTKPHPHTDDEQPVELKPQPEVTAPTPAPEITKTEMIRRAIEAGADKPKAGTEWIKQHFGVTLQGNLFSTVKNGLRLKEQKTTQTSVRHRNGKPAPAARTTGSAGELIRQLRHLMASYSADDLQDALKALSE